MREKWLFSFLCIKLLSWYNSHLRNQRIFTRFRISLVGPNHRCYSANGFICSWKKSTVFSPFYLAFFSFQSIAYCLGAMPFPFSFIKTTRHCFSYFTFIETISYSQLTWIYFCWNLTILNRPFYFNSLLISTAFHCHWVDYNQEL